MEPLKKYEGRIQWYLYDTEDPKSIDVDELATGLVEWARDNEEAFKVSEYITSIRGIWFGTFLKWTDRSEKLAAAYEMAKTLIGDRRERYAAKGIYNPQIVMKTLPLYDKEYRNMLEWQSKLRAAENACIPGTANQRIVVLDKFPETNAVPKMAAPEEKDE